MNVGAAPLPAWPNSRQTAAYRGALVVDDEMQSMPGVDHESMLSDLSKFEASWRTSERRKAVVQKAPSSLVTYADPLPLVRAKLWDPVHSGTTCDCSSSELPTPTTASKARPRRGRLAGASRLQGQGGCPIQWRGVVDRAKPTFQLMDARPGVAVDSGVAGVA